MNTDTVVTQDFKLSGRVVVEQTKIGKANMRNILIIGMGEVGDAHYRVLDESGLYKIKGIDPHPGRSKNNLADVEEEPKTWDCMIVAIRHNDFWIPIVKDYVIQYRPSLIVNCSTVPVGTSEALEKQCTGMLGSVVHSTTRGLHPNLDRGLRSIVKHIGGYKDAAISAAAMFGLAGIPTRIHESSRTTELAHILNNVAYGVNLMLADEMQAICRRHGVDYYEAVMKYTETNNEGYMRLDNPTKVRPILSPPNHKIGGHCVVASAKLLSARTPIIDLLAKYNNEQ